MSGASIELATEVAEDLDRILGHLIEHEARNVAARINSIIDAIDVLAHNPLIGHPVTGGMRELVIGHDAYGYIALYRYVPQLELVLVLAVRGQREAGFSASDPG